MRLSRSILSLELTVQRYELFSIWKKKNSGVGGRVQKLRAVWVARNQLGGYKKRRAAPRGENKRYMRK